MNSLSIVIPVYNEGANFQGLWKELSGLIKAAFVAYVIYDFDQDDTVPVVNEIIAAGESRLRTAKNHRGRGVVSAIMTGFDIV
jgi:dolichol-phosphate mannosyltransferase